MPSSAPVARMLRRDFENALLIARPNASPAPSPPRLPPRARHSSAARSRRPSRNSRHPAPLDILARLALIGRLKVMDRTRAIERNRRHDAPAHRIQKHGVSPHLIGWAPIITTTGRPVRTALQSRPPLQKILGRKETRQFFQKSPDALPLSRGLGRNRRQPPYLPAPKAGSSNPGKIERLKLHVSVAIADQWVVISKRPTLGKRRRPNTAERWADCE